MPAVLPSRNDLRDDIDAVREAFRIRPLDRIVSVLIALVAWALLRVWAYPAPYPGTASDLVAQLSGTALWSVYGAPLWTLLCRAALAITPSSLGAFVVVQALAHLCVAASIGLFHASCLRILFGLQTEESDTAWAPQACRLAAAAATVLLLAFPPVWQVAQMPLPESLGLLLAAVLARLTVSIAAEDSPPRNVVLAFCAVAGAGLVESGIVVVLFPFFLLFLLTVSLGIERMGFDSELLQGAGEGGAEPEPWVGNPGTEEEEGRRIPLLPLGLVVVALAAGACLVASLQLNTLAADPLSRRFSDIVAGITWPFQAALAEPTLRGAAVLFLLPAIAMVAMARRQLSGDGGAVETLASLLLVAVSLTQTERGGFSAWSPSPLHAVQVSLAPMVALTFAVCAAALAVRGIRAWRDRKEALAPVGRDDGWDDPFRPPPKRHTASAAICLGAAGVAFVLPPFLLLFDREPSTREALAALDGYERDLSSDIAPCRYFLSDGVHDTALRIFDPALLPVRSVAGEVVRKTRFRRNAAANEFFATSPLSAYERSLLDEFGWRALFNDWISFAPSNIASVAAQSGDECWQDLVRHGHPDWMPTRRGLVLRSSSEALVPTLQDSPASAPSDASAWRQRLANLPETPDTELNDIVAKTLSTLDGLDGLTTTASDPASLPPLEFLGELSTPDGCAAALERDPADRRARLCAAVFHAVARTAEGGGDAALETDREFEALRADEGEDAAARRLCDLVHALVVLRLRHSPEAARDLLAPYEYDEVLDPSFWYLWGLCGQAVKNDYDVMHAYEMIDKFPDKRILRFELGSSMARTDGDGVAEIAAIRSAISILPGDLFLLRRILAVQCLSTPDDLDAAAVHADRLIRRDAEYPLAHIVPATRKLLDLRREAPGSPEMLRAAGAILAHLDRARRYLPPPHRRIDAIAAKLAAGEDPGLSREGAQALVVDVARFCALPNVSERLAYETALLMQYHDPEAQNSRYLIDPMVELERQLRPVSEAR